MRRPDTEQEIARIMREIDRQQRKGHDVPVNMNRQPGVTASPNDMRMRPAGRMTDDRRDRLAKLEAGRTRDVTQDDVGFLRTVRVTGSQQEVDRAQRVLDAVKARRSPRASKAREKADADAQRQVDQGKAALDRWVETGE